MAKVALNQNALNGGELSPLMLGRQDVDAYAKGLYVCYNGLPLIQGPWTRRPGTVFLHQAKHNAKTCRLFPFQYSVTQTYILEFGEQYIRFYSSHGILVSSSQSMTSITKANPGVVTKNSHGYLDGQRLHLSDVVGMRQLDNREVVVTNKTTNTFELYDTDGVAINTTNYDTFTSGDMSPIYEVATAFAEADLANIRIVQSADTLYILHPDYPPQKLVRNSATSWTLSDIAFQDGPYLPTNTTATTLTPSAHAVGAATITASSTTGINGGQGFLATDVGRLMRLKDGSTWGWVEITAVTSTTVVDVDIKTTLTNTSARTDWRLGLWSDTTGWPSTGTFYDDRFFLAGTATAPQRLDGSKVGVYETFSPSAVDGTVADDDAVSFTLNADDVNAIKWMASNEKGLLVGTARGEWQVKPSALNEAITPTNISAKPSTRHGSADVAPVPVGKGVLFIQRAGRRLREFVYKFEVDGFVAPDMNLLAEHITRPSITELAYQEQPQSIVWAKRSDGVLLGFSYNRDNSVEAWHRHELGGYSNSAKTTIAQVESVATVPSPDATRDELYCVVKRYINGGTKRYIEYMSKLWEWGDEQEDAFQLDCGTTVVNGSPTDTVDGLWYLEGETISPYVDGAKHPTVTVSNGKFTLSHNATIVTYGYSYASDGQTMPLEGGAQNGTSQGKTKRISKVRLWLMDTLGLQLGPTSSNLTEILETVYAQNYGEATPLFTGVKVQAFDGPYDQLGQIYWRADGPFPATVLSIMPDVNVSD